MESGGYGSAAAAHLSSPAMVAFSQAAANGLSEAFRLQQRPFHSQMPDPKDLHHLSLVGSYGAHLLHGFPPHFLHSSLAGSGNGNTPSFGTNGTFVKPFPSNLPLPSAFQPPKCISALSNMEQNGIFGRDRDRNGPNESFRTSESSSPACNSMSPPVKEESMEGPNSEDGEHRDRICTPERSPETPGFRRVGLPPTHKPNHHSGPLSLHMNLCPVCGIQLSPSELDTHFLTELDRLYKLTSPAERQRLRASLSGIMAQNGMHGGDMGLHMGNGSSGPGSRWETFNRIRANRQNRLRAKTRKRKGDSESELGSPPGLAQCQTCPVCHGRLQRTPEEITHHIEECFKKSGHHYSHPHLAHLHASHPKTGVTASEERGQSANQQEEDETVDVESYGEDASTTSSSHHHSEVPPAHSSGSSMSLKLIEPQTIPSISGPATTHLLPSMLHHPHFLGQHHPATYGHPQHMHPLHHLSLAPPHPSLLRTEPQQTIPLSLSMNNHQTHTPQSNTQNTTKNTTNSNTRVSEEVTSLSSSWATGERGDNKRVAPESPQRVTPTSTNQKMDVDYEEQIHDNRTRSSQTTSSTHRNTVSHLRTYHNSRSGGEQSSASDNEDELMVDSEQTEQDRNNNIRQGTKGCDPDHTLERKSSTEEATSSVEIDSATDPATPTNTKISKNSVIPGHTPESCVSTSEPTSRAQVLEELRARIRELEGSPFKSKVGPEEEHYRCYTCKIDTF